MTAEVAHSSWTQMVIRDPSEGATGGMKSRISATRPSANCCKEIIMLRSIGSVTILALLMAGCAGGGDDSGSALPPPPPPATYTVEGTVSGMMGRGLILAICIPHSGGPGGGGPPSCHNVKQIGSDGTYSLDTVFPASYSGFDYVSIAQQPSSPPQDCVISNAAVRLQTANHTGFSVTCADHSEYSFVTNAADNTLSS